MRLPLTAIANAWLALALAGCAGAAMEGANIAKHEVVYENNIEAARDQLLPCHWDKVFPG